MKTCFASILFLSALSLNFGCQPTKVSENAPGDSSSNFGYFDGEVVASWDNGGRTMTLREDFSYVDPNNRRWTAPAGSVVDGASIPAAFWTLIGGPFEGQYRKASVVHDVGCHEMTASWEDVHRMFYDACVCGGVDSQTAKVLYYAVYHFGPRWEPVVETVIETHQTAQGQLVQEQVQRRHMRRTNPPPPTSDEIQQVVELVEDENPAPAVLEETSREVLRRRPRRGRRYNQQSELQVGQQNNGRRGRTRDPLSLTAITEQEKQWVAQQVSAYLVDQLGQNIPDEYGIEKTQEGYRVALRYYERNDRNEPIGYSSNSPTARVASDGQVLEIR